MGKNSFQNSALLKINSLPLKGFLSKENLNLDPLFREARISQIKKQLYPKEFKSVSKHLVRIK